MRSARCTATAKRTGEQCRLLAVLGATVCRSHGGAAPQVRAAAAVRLAEEQGRAVLARLNLPPVDDPLTELAKIAAEAVAWKDAMAGKVSELTELRYKAGEGGEQLRAEVALWERALDRCERFLTAMARLNIDERLAAISEAQAAAVLGGIAVACDVLRATPEQRREAVAAVRDYLAGLAA